MRKYEPVDFDDDGALRARLELPSAVELAAAQGWSVELRQGICAGPRCRAHTDLTFLGLCPACTKGAFDGRLVKTDDGRWQRADIPTMRAIVQGAFRDWVEPLRNRVGELQILHQDAQLDRASMNGSSCPDKCLGCESGDPKQQGCHAFGGAS